MDQRLQYEQLIGAKLEGLSIPNMQDMIWARVKAQLDIDMPSDDNDGGGNGPQSPIIKGPLRWGLSIVIVAVITAFFFFKNKPSLNENNPSLPITTQPINEPANQPTGPPGKANDIVDEAPLIPQVTNTPAAKPVDTSTLQRDLNAPFTAAFDSIKTIKPDSNFIRAQPPPIINDTLPPKKKGKGVSGLKDDDYRLVPKGN